MAGEPDGNVTEAVDLYWRPGCWFCAALRLGLALGGVPVRARNIWGDAEAAAVVRGVAGGSETVPTVVVGRRALVNPTTGQVVKVVAGEAPHLLPDRGLLRRLRNWPRRRRRPRRSPG